MPDAAASLHENWQKTRTTCPCQVRLSGNLMCCEEDLIMKLQKLIPVGILLLVSVATLSAQNTLPNPHDDACWSSLDALRACQLQAYDPAVDQAQRCTSYPEYQCLPAAEQPQQKLSEKHAAKGASKADDNAPVAVSPWASDTAQPQRLEVRTANRDTHAPLSAKSDGAFVVCLPKQKFIRTPARRWGPSARP